MRSIVRISPIIRRVEEVYARYPDETFLEMMARFQKQNKSDCFYLEDDRFCEKLAELCKQDEEKSPVSDLSAESLNVRAKLFAALADFWYALPDWRFMQLICNMQRAIGNEHTNEELTTLVELLSKEWANG